MTEIRSLSQMQGLQNICNERGFDINEIDTDEIEIVPEATGNSFSVFQIESWIQVKACIFQSEAVDRAPFKAALFESIARLQNRIIGSRFAVGDDRGIWIIEDIYPAQQRAELLCDVVDQLQHIVDVTQDILISAMEHGKIVGEIDINEAFGLEEGFSSLQ